MTDPVILIPSLNPDEKLLRLIQQLRKEKFQQFVVVDDGSSPEFAGLFLRADELGCVVVHHEKNHGKGTAIKTAFRTALSKYSCPNGCITVDGDGQHLPGDVRRVAEAMKAHPGALVLGIRDFRSPNVPARSFWGNRITTAFFYLTCGVRCPDTQTGLRGIPNSLLDLALSEDGSRYEYEMNFLMDAVRLAPVESVAIETVYENDNRGSHFHPVTDSCRVYGRFLRFLCSSLFGMAVDCLLFYLLLLLLVLPQNQTVFAATVIARICSGIVNFLLNRYFSFRSKKSAGRELVRYFILFFCQMLASAGLVTLISGFRVPAVLAKIVVDTALFFVSFRIQKNWVFAREGRSNGT